MRVGRVMELLRDGPQGRERLIEEVANEVARRMPVALRRAAVVNAAVRATQEHVVGRRGYAGPDGLEFRDLMDHVATPLADELTPAELAERQREADARALQERLETTDAAVWAREWLRMVSTGEIVAIDFDLMVGWFANAIERGRSAGQAEGLGGHRSHVHFAVLPNPPYELVYDGNGAAHLHHPDFFDRLGEAFARRGGAS